MAISHLIKHNTSATDSKICRPKNLLGALEGTKILRMLDTIIAPHRDTFVEIQLEWHHVLLVLSLAMRAEPFVHRKGTPQWDS